MELHRTDEGFALYKEKTHAVLRIICFTNVSSFEPLE